MAAQLDTPISEPVTYVRYSVRFTVEQAEADQINTLATAVGQSPEEYLNNVCGDAVLNAINQRLNGGN